MRFISGIGPPLLILLGIMHIGDRNILWGMVTLTVGILPIALIVIATRGSSTHD